MNDVQREIQKLKALINQKQTTAIFSNKSNESTKLALGDTELYINEMTRKFSFTRAGVKNPVMIDPKNKTLENLEYLNGVKIEDITQSAVAIDEIREIVEDQGKKITELESEVAVVDELDERLTDCESKDVEQDNRITEVETKVGTAISYAAELDERLTDCEVKDVEQDVKIAEVESEVNDRYTKKEVDDKFENFIIKDHTHTKFDNNLTINGALNVNTFRIQPTGNNYIWFGLNSKGIFSVNHDTGLNQFYEPWTFNKNLTLNGALNNYNIGTTNKDANYKAHKFIPTVIEDGVMEIGKYIDFHEYANASSEAHDYKVRLESNNGQLVTSGNMLVKGWLTCNSSLTVKGAVDIDKWLTARSGVDIAGNLGVLGTSTIGPETSAKYTLVHDYKNDDRIVNPSTLIYDSNKVYVKNEFFTEGFYFIIYLGKSLYNIPAWSRLAVNIEVTINNTTYPISYNIDFTATPADVVAKYNDNIARYFITTLESSYEVRHQIICATGNQKVTFNFINLNVQTITPPIYPVTISDSNITIGGQLTLKSPTVQNDYGRIKLLGNSINDGSLEIATADDGNEPIYVRQYSGNFVTVKRTLTLLDKSGNTIIPGDLTVTNALWFTNPSVKMDSFTYSGTDGIRIHGRISVTGAASFDSDIWCKGKKVNSNETVTHTTNVVGEIGTFCESTGDIYDGYEHVSHTDCICKVRTSTSLNKRIVGIICSEDEFASHGDVYVRVNDINGLEVGDILCPDENGYGKKADEAELMLMVLHAIPRPKITSLDTAFEGYVACFLV